MHEIELSTIYNESHVRTNQDVIMLIEQEKTKKDTKLVKIYHIVSHVFLFSVFESFFFWFYIVDQEEKAFKSHFKDIIMISNLFCLNMDLDLAPLYEYMESEHRIYNNDVPLRFTYVLNGYLLGIIVVLNILLKWNGQSIRNINVYVLKQDAIILILLFLYEYLFFQNIIYNYKPQSAMDVKSLLFDQCLT
tara:strand:+ start:790 stop:1362 length:573 start_codon:yes stop_codon:yes gene_type:complete